MPNYRRPRRSRNESDPEYKRLPGADEEDASSRAAGEDGDMDDGDDYADAGYDESSIAASPQDFFEPDPYDEALRQALDRIDDDDEDDGEGDASAVRGSRRDLPRLPVELEGGFEIVDLGQEAEDGFDDDGFDDDGFDDDDDDDDDGDDELDEPGGERRSKYRARVPLDDVLHELASTDSLPPLGHLYSLSDLSLGDAEKVRRGWELIRPERRRALVEQLVVAAEDDLDLHLGPLLRIAMADEDAGVRSRAVRGLWEDGEADLIGPLVQMLRNDPDDEARAAAATALGSYVLAGELEELDAPLAMRAEEALLAVLHDDAEPVGVRRRALESIAYSGENGVRHLIEDAYYSPHEEMRISALFAMGRSADVRWRALARAELKNPSAAVRAEAALACGELEAQSALEDLFALLQDRQQKVRLAAIFALGRIGGQDARDVLDTVILGGVAEEVEAAEQALEEMLFYADMSAALFDETLDEEDAWDSDPGDGWMNWDDRDLGEYE